MVRPSHLLACSLLLLCQVVSPRSSAQEPGDVPRPLVLDMTTLTQAPRTDAVQALVSEHTPFEPGTYPLISGASPEFLELFRWVYLADPHLACPGDLAGLEDTLEQARTMVVELELDRALVTLRKAFDALPCQLEPLDRDMLRRLFYYEGIARYYEGDTQGSLRALLASLAIDATSEPLPGFPPEITGVFEEAARRLPELPEVSLEVDPALRQADLHIDGEPLPDMADHVSLRPGFHVAQVFNSDRVARTATFFLDADENRPLSALVDIMPPGSTSYLNALFRAAIQQLRLDPAQKTALDAYCRLRGHPFILFVIVSVDTGTQELATYTPQAGLIQGVPDGLEPLPPMATAIPGEDENKKPGWLARRRQRKLEQAQARQDSAHADESGISFGASAKPRTSTTAKVRESRHKPREAERPASARAVHQETAGRRDRPAAARTVARLEMGSTAYQGDVFAGLLPSVTLPMAGPIGLHAALFYGTDFGTRTEALLSLAGIRLGLELALPLRTWSARLGLGESFVAARVVTTGNGVSKLLIEGTPEAWAGLDYLLDAQVRVGIEVAGGFSPGFTSSATAHGLWRIGVTVGWAF